MDEGVRVGWGKDTSGGLTCQASPPTISVWPCQKSMGKTERTLERRQGHGFRQSCVPYSVQVKPQSSAASLGVKDKLVGVANCSESYEVKLMCRLSF